MEWPFWTKLAVVVVGLIGGLAFMYMQCKVTLSSCSYISKNIFTTILLPAMAQLVEHLVGDRKVADSWFDSRTSILG